MYKKKSTYFQIEYISHISLFYVAIFVLFSEAYEVILFSKIAYLKC